MFARSSTQQAERNKRHAQSACCYRHLRATQVVAADIAGALTWAWWT